MTRHTPAQLMQKWFAEVWNQRRADLIGVYVSPACKIHALDETGADTIGPEGLRSFYVRLLGGLPDIHIEMHEIIESGELVAGRWVATATHRGDDLGVKATNNPMTISGMTFLRVANGQIVEAWNEWDRLAMALAIGAVAAVH